MSESKQYRLTRSTKKWTWLRWDAYGFDRRGVSIKIPTDEFRKNWITVAIGDSLIDRQLYVKLSTPKEISVDMPPVWFSNAMSGINPDFNYNEWRKSPEWKICVAGYNAAVKASNDAVMSRFDMGQTKERLFGEKII